MVSIYGTYVKPLVSVSLPALKLFIKHNAIQRMMKRNTLLCAASLLLALPLSAQGNQETAPIRTLSADSILTGDARMDSLYRNLPDVMVIGERPVVKASAGKLEYDLPRMIQDRPVDNVYEALKELPGVIEQDGTLTLGMQHVTVVLDGKVTNLSAEQLNALLKSMPADRIERVEVMYNAPARYQVRGAMINVRLRHRIGDAGTVQGEVYGKYDQEYEASFEERATLLYNGNKFSADFLYAHTHGESFNTTDKEARHWQQADGSTHLIENYEEMRGRSHTHSFRLGTDYTLAENHLLSFVYNGAYATSHTDQHTTGTQTADSRSHQTSCVAAQRPARLSGSLRAESRHGVYVVQLPRRAVAAQPHGESAARLLYRGRTTHQCLEILSVAGAHPKKRLGTELRSNLYHKHRPFVPDV